MSWSAKPHSWIRFPDGTPKFFTRIKTMRHYEFQLPYVLSGFMAHMGYNSLLSNGLFERLPPELQYVLKQASDTWSEVAITGEMLDTIDDNTWAQIAQLLSLRYD
jgi:TRAP-type C4-dicarboxylate transport system substrate-binding protein